MRSIAPYFVAPYCEHMNTQPLGVFKWRQNVNIAAHRILEQQALPVIRTDAMNILALTRNTVYFAAQLTMVPPVHLVIQMDATNMPATANIVSIAGRQIPAAPVVRAIRINVTKDDHFIK